MVAWVLLDRRVERALEVPPANEQPVEFIPVAERPVLPFWGGEDVDSVTALPGGIYIAGAAGVSRLATSPNSAGRGLTRVDVSMPLPTRRAAVMSAWRTDLVVGLGLEGLFVYRDGSWSELRSGFGTLHVRALAETPAGELWIGAREGLFRIGFGERILVRLHTSPVRSIALAEGGRVVHGGETGLFVTQGGATRSIRIEGVETPWVDTVAIFAGRISASTPQGVFAAGHDAVLRSVPNGGAIGSMAVLGDHLFATADPPEASVRRFDNAGGLQVERLPSAVRRVFAVGDRLLADTENGLAERSDGAWRVISKRRQQESFGNAHIGALAAYRGRVVAGFFDGGLAELLPEPGTSPGVSPGISEDGVLGKNADAMILRSLPDSSAVWAVNGLLDAGGVLHVASLRGAFRFDGSGLALVKGSGAAFSLAVTRGGVAIGYGEGVLLPERRLLSAFHGLPGNQATALAAAETGLLVGTLSGLGYIEGLRVRWRVASGEGKLPHPWVTAILPVEGSVLVGTYGGGLTRRKGGMSDAGDWQPFVETQGLKVNTGCLVAAGGRIYAGTDGTGLFRLSVDGTRFERLKLSLPSPRVTALFEWGGFLYIGTDEGLTRWPVERDVMP